MTIYMTHTKFHASSEALDKARLDRQINLVGKTLKVLEGDPTDDSHEDMIVRAWEGYTAALAWYGLILCNAWLQWKPSSQVTIRTRQAVWFNEVFEDAMEFDAETSREEMISRLPELPPWVGNKNVHRSHRSNLIRKFPARYADMFPGTPEDMPHLHPQIISPDLHHAGGPKPYRLRIVEHELVLLKRGERKLPEYLQYDEAKNEVLEVES